MKDILLSVIVPVYNSAPYLVSALESLLFSGCESVEFLIVDDGSTDSSLDICRRFCKEDSRFKIFTKARGGPSSARNYALERALGEYVTFLDADDRVTEGGYGRLENIIKENSHPDLIVFGAELFPRGAPDYLRALTSPRNITYSKFEPEVLFSEVGARPFLWMQAMKRSIIEKNGLRMDESISLGEDQLFQMAFIPHANRTVFVADKLYEYRWYSPSSIMNVRALDRRKKLLQHIEIIDKAFKLFGDRGDSSRMMGCLLDFSVSFVYNDLLDLTEKDESECAQRLLEVFEKHGADKYKNMISVWAKERYGHIRLMAIEDVRERITALRLECSKVKSELNSLKDTEAYRRYEKTQKKSSSIVAKVTRSLREDGVRVTLSKIMRRLRKI